MKDFHVYGANCSGKLIVVQGFRSIESAVIDRYTVSATLIPPHTEFIPSYPVITPCASDKEKYSPPPDNPISPSSVWGGSDRV